jgi:hypothetical protein
MSAKLIGLTATGLAAAGLAVYLLRKLRFPARSTSAFLLDSSGALSASGNEVSLTERATQSTKWNALWREGKGLSPSHREPLCFQVTVNAGDGIWVGLTDEAHFGPGWACKSLAYGGNLSDGAGLLRGQFGPRLVPGSVVAVRAELLEDTTPGGGGGLTLSVSLAHGGRGLGQAFKIEKFDSTAVGPLFPLISFSDGPASASIEVHKPCCMPASAFEKVTPTQRDSIGGSWAAPASAILVDSSATAAAAAATSPPARGGGGGGGGGSGGAGTSGADEVIFTVDTKRWALTARVANTLSVQISASAPHASKGGVRATMMMPPPELQPLEHAVTNLLSSVTALGLESSGKLAIRYGRKKALSLAPHDTREEPVRLEEVRWMAKAGS